MNIIQIGKSKSIMKSDNPVHNYFAWPSVSRLCDGRIAVVSSGYRLAHVCPFGKTVIAFSSDEGEQFSLPTPVFDTPLDDRDGGVVAFGNSGVIVTSFNNSVDFQRRSALERFEGAKLNYVNSYLDLITPMDEEKYLGASFRVSFDNGMSFGDIYKSPVTSPHGPMVCRDGRIIWIGRYYDHDNREDLDGIYSYLLNPESGEMELLGKIPDVPDYDGKRLTPCEPHSIELSDGRILTHIRVQAEGFFSTYQSMSYDGGKTFTEPERILDTLGGAPAHIIKHSSGALISVYGRRAAPYGIRAMFSYDEGRSWEVDYEIASLEDGFSRELIEAALADSALISGACGDLGYPSTVELSDGSLLTIFYAHRNENSPAEIFGQKWRFEK